MCKQLYLILFLFTASFSLFAQMQEPVKWTHSINDKSEIAFATQIETGWHLYTLDLPSGGPIATSFVFETINGAELSGKVTTLAGITSSFDDLFEMDISWYNGNPTFIQKIKITNIETFSIKGYIEYMSCNDENCVMGNEEFSFSKQDLPSALTTPKIVVKKEEEIKTNPLKEPIVEEKVDTITQPEIVEEIVPVADKNIDLWTPVIDELKNYGEGSKDSDKSLLTIFLLCFGGGFIALLTPCVWPIIPMTVSFFLKRSKSNKKKAVGDAIVYGISIIVIYLVLGLLITVLFGASALNELSDRKSTRLNSSH